MRLRRPFLKWISPRVRPVTVPAIAPERFYIVGVGSIPPLSSYLHPNSLFIVTITMKAYGFYQNGKLISKRNFKIVSQLIEIMTLFYIPTKTISFTMHRHNDIWGIRMIFKMFSNASNCDIYSSILRFQFTSRHFF